jgi:hypothetical protein
MIARQEYNINNDNREVCKYLRDLTKLDSTVKVSLKDFLDELTTKLPYISKSEQAYITMRWEANDAELINMEFDRILKKMNERFNCDQIYSDIPSNFELIDTEAEIIEDKWHRLIDEILRKARAEGIVLPPPSPGGIKLD